MAILQNNQNVGDYHIQYLIKENRYAETYRAEDQSGTPFFLKLFVLKNTPEKMLDKEHRVRSIEVAKRLKHKNVISYVADGTIDDEQAGLCQYLVTNYFSGELLADKLQREGPMPQEQATQVFRGILEGLHHMHDQGLLHNDLTPRNIIMPEKTDGEPEIIDLGHVSGYVGGAPPFDTSDLDERYEANETFVGMYDASSDVFAAMAVYYTMLTGQAPWAVDFAEGATRKERIAQVRKARQEELQLDALPDDEGLRRIVQNGLALRQADRYSKPQDVLRDLDNPAQASEPKKPQQGQGDQLGQQKPKQGEQQAEEPQADVEVKRGSGHGFQDIAGMADLKAMLSQKVIFILKDKARAEKYRLTPPNGMLLYGPPGCGKSFFAEKFAEETGFNFILVKASDLGSIYVHGTQGKIADLFKKAEQAAPTVLCFDEFDAFVPDRSAGGTDHQAGEVNEFLTQLNNCSGRGIFVIATSNRPDKIDPAVLRTGRIDRQVYVPLPDEDARHEMFALHLKGRPCEDIDTKKLAQLTEGYIASDIAYIVNDAAMGAAFSDRPITQEQLEQTISSIRPSIRKESLKAYDDIRARMEGINHKNALPKIGFV